MPSPGPSAGPNLGLCNAQRGPQTTIDQERTHPSTGVWQQTVPTCPNCDGHSGREERSPALTVMSSPGMSVMLSTVPPTGRWKRW